MHGQPEGSTKASRTVIVRQTWPGKTYVLVHAQAARHRVLVVLVAARVLAMTSVLAGCVMA